MAHLRDDKGRSWWPLDWADEVMPPGRADPNDWLIDASGHFYIGYRLDATDVNEHEKRYFSRGVDCGDIVKFICSDDLGSLDVEISKDGSYRVLEGVVDPRATHFWSGGNSDSLADSMGEYAKFVAELLDAGEFPMRDTVRMAWWSDQLPYKLVYGIEKTRFEPVSAAEARQ